MAKEQKENGPNTKTQKIKYWAPRTLLTTGGELGYYAQLVAAPVVLLLNNRNIV